MPGQTWGSEPGVDSSHESEITVLTSNWQLKQESNVYVESNKKKKKKKTLNKMEPKPWIHGIYCQVPEGKGLEWLDKEAEGIN